jgi:hypothetical protein
VSDCGIGVSLEAGGFGQVLRDAVAAGPLATLTLSAQLGEQVLEQIVGRSRVDVAIDKAGRVHQRDRALPAWVVVYLLFALCLFSGEGYGSVLRQVWPGLNRWRGRQVPVPDASAVPRARMRLGVAPLRTVFGEVAGPIAAPDTKGAFAFGLLLVSVDGTVLDAPDSTDNDAAFDRYAGGGAARAQTPQVRLSMLIECGTHAVIGARFDGTQVSEQIQADELLACLRPGMLALADRNFFSFGRWRAAQATGADLLWRVKTGTGQGIPRLPVITTLADGSYLSQIKETTAARRLREKHTGNGTGFLDYHRPITVRVIEFTVTCTTTDGKIRRQRYRLLTTLLDPKHADAAQIAALYRQRWESETSFGHLKTRLRGPRAVLRSRHPDGVRQEIWAYLCVYQCLCRMAATIAHTAEIDPDRISFTAVLRAYRRILHTGNGQLEQDLQQLEQEVLHQLLPDRRSRVSTRGTKPRQRLPRTQQASYHIVIEPPENH